ncbi:ABC transporter substrate-binding protein [Paenibacillus nasutitermitis]|uniref:ABC transporter substrate-binding protein n=1 Tax=Paenibacillus nasutitermitis TaxID=1652958 RepID=A0A917DND9_9BACL|nr:sugar ABC transporter substrate-binding protein [Paenibacillus nasutitermitis]GGD51368.1 hypothetical protein GCM10010911_06130 [Paenibacillus nasutitermitis]
MKTRKRALWSLVILLLIVMTTAACSSGNNKGGNTKNEPVAPADTSANTKGEGNKAEGEGDKTDPPAAESNDPVTLRMVVWGPPLWTETIPAKFQEKYPNITLKVEKIDGGDNASVLEKITALSAAGTPADLTWIPAIPGFMKDDLLVDLGPYMETDPVLSKAQFSDSVLDVMKWKGNLVALPRAMDAYFMFVNKDLLAKHGMDMPTKDWTWDEFREMAKKATDPNAGEYGIAPGVFNYQAQAQAYAVSNGLAPNLSFMDENWNQSLLTDPKVLSAVQWVADLGWVDGSRPNDEQSTKAGVDPAGWGSWVTGKFAFDIMGQWEGASRKEAAKFDWDLLPLPKGTVSQAGYNGISPMGILKGSPNVDAAVKFLSWLVSEDGQRVLMSDGNIPLTSDPQMWDELTQIETWKGKNIKDAVTQECCMNRTLIGEEKYINWFDGEIGGIIKNGGDLSIFQRKATEFNTYTTQLRKELGLE